MRKWRMIWKDSFSLRLSSADGELVWSETGAEESVVRDVISSLGWLATARGRARASKKSRERDLLEFAALQEGSECVGVRDGNGARGLRRG